MGALYKGLIATGVLSILGLALATTYVIGWGEIGTVAGKVVTGSSLFVCGLDRPCGHRPHRRHHRILHRHRQAPGRVDRAGLRHRPRHQRDPGPRGVARIDGASGAGHRRRHHLDLPARRPLRHRDRGHDHARPRRHDRRARRLRPGHRQRRRHRGNGRPAEGSAPVDRRARRGRQHHQGDHQGLRDRLGGLGRAGAVRGLHQRHPALHRDRRALFQGRRRGRLRPLQPIRRRRAHLRRPDPLSLRRHRDDRGRARGRLGGARSAPPVQGNAGHHERHAASRLRTRRRSADAARRSAR